MADVETKSRLLAHVLQSISNRGHGEEKTFPKAIKLSIDLPDGVSPRSVLQQLPLDWRAKEFGPSDFTPEVQEALKDNPDLLGGVVFYPPRSRSDQPY